MGDFQKAYNQLKHTQWMKETIEHQLKRGSKQQLKNELNNLPDLPDSSYDETEDEEA